MWIDALAAWAAANPEVGVLTAAAACAAGVPVVRAVLRAVADGRELTVGPVRIGAGARPGPPEQPAAGGSAPAPAPVAVADPPPVAHRPERLFSTLEAELFYSLVAPSYDIRNTGPLLSTQFVTRAKIQRARAGRQSLDVLDLGGGTGREIATHFADDPTVSWTYVDFCPAMADQFRANLVEDPVPMRVRVLVEDIQRVHERLEPESYDVVLLSLVLTSMPRMPDLAPITRLLRPGGVLVVSDIDPLYTERNQLYSVRVADGEAVALRTTPVQPHQIAAHAIAAGLIQEETESTTRGSASYAFVSVYRRPGPVPAPRPPADRRGMLARRPAGRRPPRPAGGERR
jgi:SAM-dependent methyltransferase